MDYEIPQSNPVANSSELNSSVYYEESEDISYSQMQTETQTLEGQRSEELKQLLNTWNMVHLLDHLLSKFYMVLKKFIPNIQILGEQVYIDVLKVIKRHHIHKLLTEFNLGTQIMFEYHLEKWRCSIGIPFNETLPEVNLLNSTALLLPSTELPSPTSSTSTSSRFSPYPRPSESPDEGVEIYLGNILNNTSRGKQLVGYFKKYGKFEEEQRSSLIGIIAQYFSEKGIKLSLATSYRLEREIIEKFPSEKLVRKNLHVI